MLKVYVEPVGLHSRAMVRVAKALQNYAPAGVRVVSRVSEADLVIAHVISGDALVSGRQFRKQGQRYAAIQYCLTTSSLPNVEDWLEYWANAEVVWSYYDLGVASALCGFRFFHAPLGLDDPFRAVVSEGRRERLVVTSGYVAGPGAEAIEEVWRAAGLLDMKALHVGPSNVAGMAKVPGWRAVSNLKDEELASLYRRAEWVSGLRHVEGLELPAAEGLACGARPILFDQPAMRQWYGDAAVYVPEYSGEELVGQLASLLSVPWPVSGEERKRALDTFDWSRIVPDFWRQVTAAVEVAA